MLSRVLVAGLNCRPVAVSAKKFIPEVYVVDYFGDVDLKRAADGVYSIGKEYSLDRLLKRTKKVIGRVKPEGVLLTSELGCNPDTVREVGYSCKIIGNGFEQVNSVREWKGFFHTLDKLGIKHPKTILVDKIMNVEWACKTIGFPLVTKPLHGSSGQGVRLIHSLKEALTEFDKYKRILIQEYVRGVNASVSVISTGADATAVSLNEQLLGKNEFGQENQFGYCGNIVPLESRLERKAREDAETICREFKLVGSVGIDMVLADQPYVIEVNPRFHDTLECIERAYDINLVKAHIEAIGGILPTVGKSGKTYAKSILFADGRLKIAGNLENVEGAADIMREGAIVERGNPVCSAIAEGKDRDAALSSLNDKIITLKKCFRRI
ncbi:MAG: ATP-grasp domain-containing protein [Candidatus Altiarchaeota archaeon]